MYYSSADEDFCDFEIFENLSLIIVRKPREIRTRPNHFNIYNDSEFVERFRLSKHCAYIILELIGPHMKKRTKWLVLFAFYINILY